MDLLFSFVPPNSCQKKINYISVFQFCVEQGQSVRTVKNDFLLPRKMDGLNVKIGLSRHFLVKVYIIPNIWLDVQFQAVMTLAAMSLGQYLDYFCFYDTYKSVKYFIV